MKQSEMLRRILADKDFIDDHDYLDHWLVEKYIEDHLSLDMILKDKKFLQSLSRAAIQDLEENYLEYLEDTAELKPQPRSKINYVGIELECFTHYDRSDLFNKIVKHGLEKNVQAVSDGSIEADFGDDCELRILLPEKDLAGGLKKVGKLLTKGKFGINKSCGLHVHLDMRNRNVNVCYERLLKFQNILFGMIKKERWNNTYCKPTSNDNRYDRYVAINKEQAYAAHRTIEVRLHHATLDMKQIELWVKLLLKVISSKTPPPKETKADVLKWGKKQRGISQYISKNFNEDWFKEKRVASGGD